MNFFMHFNVHTCTCTTIVSQCSGAENNHFKGNSSGTLRFCSSQLIQSWPALKRILRISTGVVGRSNPPLKIIHHPFICFHMLHVLMRSNKDNNLLCLDLIFNNFYIQGGGWELNCRCQYSHNPCSAGGWAWQLTRLKLYLLVKNARLLYKTVCLLTFQSWLSISSSKGPLNHVISVMGEIWEASKAGWQSSLVSQALK